MSETKHLNRRYLKDKLSGMSFRVPKQSMRAPYENLEGRKKAAFFIVKNRPSKTGGMKILASS